MSEREPLLQSYLGIMPRTPEESVLRLLVETGIQAVDADEGSLLVYDPDGDDLRFAMVCGSADSEETLLGQRVPIGKGVTGLAAQTGEVQIGAPTYKDVEQSETVGAIQAVIAAPMELGDRLMGVITAVSNREGKRFSGADGRLYGSLAVVAAVVVDQSQRLRALADGTAAEGGLALDTADPTEREILDRLSRLLQQDPEIVRQVAAILGSLERMAGSDGAGG